MASIKFSLEGIEDQKQPLSAPTGNIYDNLPFNQLPNELRFSEMGGTPVALRASITRVVLMKLAGTGVLAALVGVNSTNKSVSFSCCLSAAVNFVASVHYYYIHRIRAQSPPDSHAVWASGRDEAGEWKGRSEDKNDSAKVFAQELSVDGWRFSDWSITLWMMTLELYELASSATGGAESWLDKFLAAALMPVMIFLGGLYRFYASELRSGVKDGKKVEVEFAQGTLGVVGFCLSCAVFVIVVLGIIDPIRSEKCPPGSVSTSCPITIDSRKYDASAVMLLTLIWIGYPVVSIASRLLSIGEDSGVQYNAWISLFKDLTYGVLDVTAKGGLAMYSVYRSTWL